jgi:ATP-dependent DNA ligase
MFGVPRRIPFIDPMAPTLALRPPAGSDFLHEVKFDGWRAQLHGGKGGFALYSKRGADLSRRFARLKPLADALPAKGAVLDCELVAVDETGMPSFRALMEQGKTATLALVAFDLLHLDGVRLTPLPLEERKSVLETLVAKVGSPHLQYSAAFADPEELLEACNRLHFEGIVSKRKGSPYRSGPTKDWL